MDNEAENLVCVTGVGTVSGRLRPVEGRAGAVEGRSDRFKSGGDACNNAV